MQKRIPEIDFFRTLALVLMVFYHFIYDLDEWTNLPIDVDTPFWFIIGKTAALLFIFLSAVSAGFSRNPARNGIKVLFWGLIITGITFIILPEQYVRFGILHFLGTMMLLYPLIKQLSNRILILATPLFLGVGLFFLKQTVNTFWLIPFGLMHPQFNTIDFYPLLPYSGVSFLGILFYRKYYNQSNPNTNPSTPSGLSSFFDHPLFRQVSRYSLQIYLIHQPILLALILGITKLAR